MELGIKYNEKIDKVTIDSKNVTMVDPYSIRIQKIFGMLGDVHEIAQTVGIPNIHRPGLVRDLLTAQRLHHNVLEEKKGSSACNREDCSILYHYYHSTEVGTCQIHDFHGKRDEIFTRNEAIFMVFYEKNDHLGIKRIYKINPQDALNEAMAQYEKSSKDKVHIAFKEEWCKMVGQVVD